MIRTVQDTEGGIGCYLLPASLFSFLPALVLYVVVDPFARVVTLPLAQAMLYTLGVPVACILVVVALLRKSIICTALTVVSMIGVLVSMWMISSSTMQHVLT